MAKQISKLKMLPVNRTVVFYSPIEGGNVLVRTGTIAEGSCFFHSLLHGYSKDYVSMDRKDRMKFVRRLRGSMAGKVNKENWEDMGGGLVAKVPFQENVHKILKNFYKFVGENSTIKKRNTRKLVKILIQDKTHIDFYKLMADLIPLHVFERDILPKSYERTQDEKIKESTIAIIEDVVLYLSEKEEMKKIPEQKAEYVKEKIVNFLETSLKIAEKSAYKSYVKGIQNVTEDVDIYTIEFISERFKRDIYFLDGSNRLPYNNCPTPENLKNRKSMIVIWIANNHYEVVGRLLPGNRVQREFDHDDPLIKKINTFLLNPEKIPEEYPELSQYLPSEYQNDEEISECSENYYDSSDNSSNSESE